MIAGLFIAAALLYCLVAALPFTTLPILHPYIYYTVGAICSVLTGAMWLTVAKFTEKSKIMLMGTYWDIMLTLTYIAVPVIFFAVRPSLNVSIGIGLIIIGIIVTKL